MPRAAAVVAYPGKRGTVYRIKYADAAGRQVQETLGREAEGWTEARAQRELGKRLDLVERERWRKPGKLTFAEFAERFERDYLPGRNLKRSTIINYEGDLRGHLVPFFGELALAEIEPEQVDGYVAAKTRAGLSPKTITNHLVALSVVFKVARRWRLVSTNPVAAAERPRLDPPEMNVLDEAEIARLLGAYVELEGEATPSEAPWWRVSRRIVVVALGTALRRGELLGLSWDAVDLLERRLHVRRALVRGRYETPKSRAGRRSLELGPRVLAELEAQWSETRYRGDDDPVFGHPLLGTPLDGSKLASGYMKPALARAGIVKPFRPWHDLRHTALTHDAAAGNPQAYVQLRAGHAQGSITERYIHAAQVLFPGAVERAESRVFGPLAE